MARKRIPSRSRQAHHDVAEPRPGVNGFDHDAAHHEGAEQAVPAETHHDEADTLAASYHDVGGFVSRLVYTASYTLSFGVVFPVMFVAQAMPMENALMRGLIDGGHAAGQAVAALYETPAHPANPEAAPTPEPATV
jgi:hypothetical protein